MPLFLHLLSFLKAARRSGGSRNLTAAKKKQRSKQHTSALLHVLYCDWIGRIHAKILHFQRDDNQGFIDIDIQIFPICSNETTYCIGNPHANSNRSRAGRRRKLQKVKSGDAQGI